jgi:hypothetical protein
VARRTLDFIEFGREYSKWKQVTFGADNQGQNNAPFKVAMFGFGHTTLTGPQIQSLNSGFLEYLREIESPTKPK